MLYCTLSHMRDHIKKFTSVYDTTKINWPTGRKQLYFQALITELATLKTFFFPMLLAQVNFVNIGRFFTEKVLIRLILLNNLRLGNK